MKIKYPLPANRKISFKTIIAACLLLCGATLHSSAQLTFTAAALTQTQNFNASATTALPSGWTIDTKNSGANATATDATATSLSSTSSGSAYKYISGADYSIGFLNSGSFVTNNNITGQLVNNTGSTITSLDITFNLKKYRNGARQWDWTFFAGNTVATAVSVPAGNHSFPADAANGSGIFPPLTTSMGTITIPVSIANGGSYYLKWNMTGLGGSTNGQAIGLDDVTVTATISVPCTTPTGLTANNITTTTADLSWGVVAGAAGYEYVVDQSAATPVVAGTPTVSTTYNATGLTPSTTYYLHVRTNCGASFSSWSTALAFTTLTPCPNPTGLAANGITTTTANLSWNTVVGAPNYEYIVDQNAASPIVPGTLTAATTYNATGLTPATTYYLHVRAKCGSPNYSAWVTVSFTTLTPCPDPTGLAANNITTTSADLSWNTVVGAPNYEYIVDQNPASPIVPGTLTAATTYNAIGLTPATTYYLHVRAKCGSPNYSAWVTTSFVTLTPCPDPTGLAANNITTTSADLSWNTVVGALNYEYIVDQDPATPILPGTLTAATTYSATALTPTTTYYLHVRAKCGSPNYSAWVTTSFITLTPCPDPSGLAANNITTTSAILTWNTIASALNYEYIIDQNPATPLVPGTVTAITTYNATGLAPSTTYYLHVRANCGTPNYSAWVTVSFITLTPCPDPANIAANNITTTSANLSWDNIPTALNYEYIVDQDPATPIVPGTVITQTAYNPTGLTPSTTYYLHLRANCGSPNYSAWITTSFTTLTPCPDPTGLSATNITTSSADLGWDNIPTALNYEYIVDQDPATPIVPGSVTTTPVYNATALTSSTTYYLHVRANCGSPNYSAWVTSSFITRCPDPTGLTASLITDVSALLSWDSLAGYAYEYTIDQLPAAPIVAGTPIANTNYTAAGLNPATTYYLHLRTDCGAGNFSNWVSQAFTTMNLAGTMLVGWDVNTLSAYGPSPYAPTTVPPAHVASSGLIRGSNISVPASPSQATDNAWGGMGFYGTGGPYVVNTQQDCIDNNAFLYFTVKSLLGYTLSLSSFDMFFGRYSIASPQNVTVQYGIDSNNFVDLATNVHTDTPINAWYAFPTIDLSGIPALQQVTSGHTIYFRIIPAYSANDTGTAAWYLYNGNTNPLLYDGADLLLKGSFDVALPLELVSFTGFAGHNSTDGNKLTWVTANEQQIKNFDLERSYDGKTFSAVVAIAAKGNTTSQSVYQYNDKGSTATHTFYRLKIYDNNGSFKYSKIVGISTTGHGENINLYPNPVHSSLSISGCDPNETYTVKITDMLGRAWDIKPVTGQQQATINIEVGTLPNGVYVLQISSASGETQRSIRFVKQ